MCFLEQVEKSERLQKIEHVLVCSYDFKLLQKHLMTITRENIKVYSMVFVIIRFQQNFLIVALSSLFMYKLRR